MTTRRGFLGAMLAAAAAPAFVKVGVLMPVRQITVPPLVLWGDGIHDDTAALQAAMNGKRVLMANGTPYTGLLAGGAYLLSRTIVWAPGDLLAATGCYFDGRAIKGGGPVIEIRNGAEGSLCHSYIEGPSDGAAVSQSY
jgi:hypothetical protein